jgi:Spore germination protein.
MKQDSRELPDNLIMALITHIYIGWGLLYLAKLATLHLTYNSYWGILVALLIVIPFLWLVSVLTRTYPGLSISQVFGKIFGTTLGITLAIIFFLHIAYFQLIFLRDSQLMVYTYFFKKTPLILMTGLLMAGVLYTAWRGAWSIGRLAAFMLFPPFLIILGL